MQKKLEVFSNCSLIFKGIFFADSRILEVLTISVSDEGHEI